MIFTSNVVKLDLDLDPDQDPDLDPDSDLHLEKLLDLDPHKMNVDPQPWSCVMHCTVFRYPINGPVNLEQRVRKVCGFLVTDGAIAGTYTVYRNHP